MKYISDVLEDYLALEKRRTDAERPNRDAKRQAMYRRRSKIISNMGFDAYDGRNWHVFEVAYKGMLAEVVDQGSRYIARIYSPRKYKKYLEYRNSNEPDTCDVRYEPDSKIYDNWTIAGRLRCLQYDMSEESHLM